MTRLFLPPVQFSGETACIEGASHLHLARVLRARPGDVLLLLDGEGRGFRAVVQAVEKAETLARIEGEVELPPEPPVHIAVAQALGKADKFETVVQHGTEAGASVFIPVRAERCVADVPAAKVADRVARWQAIARGAAEQSGRARIPEVYAPQSFGELLAALSKSDVPAVLLHPGPETISLREWLAARPELTRMALCVGPEGGWSGSEVLRARESNIATITLGPRVLRTETAALVAVSQILFGRE